MQDFSYLPFQFAAGPGKNCAAVTHVRNIACPILAIQGFAAIPPRNLLERNPSLNREAVDDVILGCANQAGEDNRNVARMALLLAGLPVGVPGATLNRLCGSGLDAVASSARLIRSGEARVVLAGGVESMSRAPYVMSKSATAFSRESTAHTPAPCAPCASA